MVVQTSARAGGGSQPEALLPVFAVRAELAPYTDISFFDQQVGAAIEYGARTGDFDQLRKGLYGWLQAALSAKHMGELTGKSIAERSRILDRLIRAWQDEHPAQELYR